MLKIKNLSVTFSDTHSVQAVQDVSLILKEKQKVFIIGETGSGKSVLLLAILRLLSKSAKVSGEIIYNEKNILLIKEKEMNSLRGAELAYVPQGSGNSMNPLMTVGYQISEPLIKHKKVSKKQAIKQSIELLKQFNIEDETNRVYNYPHMFSGGMKQRALVAMGISAGAKYIFADEPIKGLDEYNAKKVIESFKSLTEQAVLCVTHDLNFAREVGEYIHVMYAARQVEMAAADELFSNPLHPYMQDMINAMPENGLKSVLGFAPPNAENIGGCAYKERCIYYHQKCNSKPPMIEVNLGHKVRCWKYARQKNENEYRN